MDFGIWEGPRINPPHGFEGWLYTHALNKCSLNKWVWISQVLVIPIVEMHF